MHILADLEAFINEFNEEQNIHFSIDTIRITYQKQHKKNKLDKLGEWRRVSTKNSKIKRKLQKRLLYDEVTTAYQLESYNIYYYNIKDTSSTNKKYRFAEMVIFGMRQYHTAPPPKEIIESIFNILIVGNSKHELNIDVCYDASYKPKIKELSKLFTLTQFITSNGVITSTYYINNPEITMIEKVVIYNKQLKNKLGFPVWRVEAKILIPNTKVLALPLHEFKSEIIEPLKPSAYDIAKLLVKE